jgi:uridine kinase
MQKPHIIGITGLSGAGKTYTTTHLAEKFSESILALSHDNYSKDTDKIGVDRWEKADYDNPQAYDNDVLVQHLKDLLAGKSIESFLYNFDKHDRVDKKVTLAPKPIIIIEGLFVFNLPELRSLIDLKVFLDAQADIRFCRRLNRDIHERGIIDIPHVEWFIKRYLNHIKPMQEAFVLPEARHANLEIDTDEGGKVAVEVLSGYIKDILAGNLSSVEIGKKFEIKAD